jgi:hypothetical protein
MRLSPYECLDVRYQRNLAYWTTYFLFYRHKESREEEISRGGRPYLSCQSTKHLRYLIAGGNLPRCDTRALDTMGSTSGMAHYTFGNETKTYIAQFRSQDVKIRADHVDQSGTFVN